MADNSMPILQPLPFPLLTNKPRSSAQSASIRVPEKMMLAAACGCDECPQITRSEQTAFIRSIRVDPRPHIWSCKGV